MLYCLLRSSGNSNLAARSNYLLSLEVIGVNSIISRSVCFLSYILNRQNLLLFFKSAYKCFSCANQKRVRYRRLVQSICQDVAAALILSEAVYKAVDRSLKQAVEEVVKVSAELPQILHQPLKVQWSLPHVSQRCRNSPAIFVFKCTSNVMPCKSFLKMRDCSSVLYSNGL